MGNVDQPAVNCFRELTAPIRTVLFVIISCVIALPALATPAAVVFALQGTTDPKLSEFEEISAGSTIHLQENATLTLKHYETCKSFTLSKGSIEIYQDNFSIKNGVVTNYAKNMCPKRAHLKNKTTYTGAIKTRSVKIKNRISKFPKFIFQNENMDALEKMHLFAYDNGKTIDLKRNGRIFFIKDKNITPKHGKAYVLRAYLSSGEILENYFLCEEGTDDFIFISERKQK